MTGSEGPGSPPPSAPNSPEPERPTGEPKRLAKLKRRAQRLLDNPKQLEQVLKRVGRKKAKQATRSADQYRGTLVLLIDLVRDFVKGRYRDISPNTVVVALAALLYFLMPFDAVPDFILSLGMIDDFAILAWVAKHFQQELTHYQSWREKEDSSPDSKSDDP